MKRALLSLIGILWLWLFPTVVWAQGPDATDNQFLSGTWEGTEGLAQRGKCEIGALGRSPTGIQYTLVRWIVTTEANESFSAEVYFGNSKKPTGTWMGTIDRDFSVRLVASRRAQCSGQQWAYKITYEGRVLQRKGKYEMSLKAADPVCPEMGCVFESRIELKKK